MDTTTDVSILQGNLRLAEGRCKMLTTVRVQCFARHASNHRHIPNGSLASTPRCESSALVNCMIHRILRRPELRWMSLRNSRPST